MTLALESKLGGSPFDPAGIGKSESVKAMGHQLGRNVVVYNCDSSFDHHAMERIFFWSLLVSEDTELFHMHLHDIFSNVGTTLDELSDLKKEIRSICDSKYLVCAVDKDEAGAPWMEMILQIQQICTIQHGVILLGPAVSAKSTCYDVLLKALEKVMAFQVLLM
ncbi:hypothetical protein B566_EDAN017860 [Ephemera danica]|nr:hypothetical protein B566_EDAN017860 [Ephemera danica]